MKMNVRALAAILFLCAQARPQTLVYALSYSDTAASRRARIAAMPAPGLRSVDQDIATLRNTVKNEIYSVSPADGKRSLLFSDDGMHLEISAWGTVSGPAKAYTVGTWHEHRATPTPGYYSDDGIYELALDGSNHFRKLASAQGAARPLLDPQADKAASTSPDGGSLLVYSVPEWKLLSTTVSLSKLEQAHCPHCVVSYGWMADGKRLFAEMTVDGDEESASDREGIYILSAAGEDLGAIPAEIGALRLTGDLHPQVSERHFLGQLPDGRYLFEVYVVRKGSSSAKLEPFLVISASGSKPQKQFPLRFSIGDAYIAPSGRFLAFIEQRQTRDYRSESHLWVKDLESGEEKELAATPPSNPPSSPELNVTLFVLGWMD